MNKEMKALVKLVKQYNAQERKVAKRTENEYEKFFGSMSAFRINGKSSVLLAMESKLQELSAEIQAIVAASELTPDEWDDCIDESGLCLDEWGYDAIHENDL